MTKQQTFKVGDRVTYCGEEKEILCIYRDHAWLKQSSGLPVTLPLDSIRPAEPEPPCPVKRIDRVRWKCKDTEWLVPENIAIAICFQHGVEGGWVQPYRSEDDNIVYFVPSVELTFKSPAEAVTALWPSLFGEGGGK